MNNINIFLFALFLLPLLASCEEENVYIVQFRGHNGEKTLHEIEDTHHSYLLSVKNNEEEAKASRLYSYQYSINGFAAVLTFDEASKLSELEEVLLVHKSEPGLYTLQTTRSWEFLGLNEDGGRGRHNYKMGEGLLSKAKYGQEVIVGVLDTGIWPESESFNDEGMGPVPKSWKGICQTGDAFDSSHCNKYYMKGYEHALGGCLDDTLDYLSPRDKHGHGTHTASTVAGRRVANVSVFGLARGTASGGAPLARLAIYKVCWAIPQEEMAVGNTCLPEDMLAGIDDAIRDGVDVMSISVGFPRTFFAEDAIANGALHAAKKNIVVVCAAGNSGPAPATLSNDYPWIITVGASSLDRDILGSLVLGNGLKIMGETTPYGLEKKHPLVYAPDVVVPAVAENESAHCLPGSLDPKKVKGKVVFCMIGLGMTVGKVVEVKRAGGAGYILGNTADDGDTLLFDFHVLPGTAVSSNDANKIIQYIKSTKNPTAIINRGKTVFNSQPAPSMASFSSRGPNPIDPNLLKPDITAPGLNILAAWSEGDSVTTLSSDKRFVKYNFQSGTSMATPHVAAVAALLKVVHPKWSSAAIRSAIMTTAGSRNNRGEPITDQLGQIATPFMFGSGHIRPTKAVDPGLVYDASYEDYLLYICSIGTDKPEPKFKFPENPPSPVNLNYPSFAIPKLNGTVIVKRTVTNVAGDGKSVYFFRSKPPMGISVKATPSVLFFNHVGQKRSFPIKVKTRGGMARNYLKNEYGFGWYSWNDGLHNVRSPMAIALA
ncbi:subtilisin-like protease SBT5.6 [Pistacia vera]|uniref:subtilisin-like protease SBT5.6 n=1 Tax=Pistacia vera TaxID=55513 RepID=UPI001263C1D3|nr:subtilisin-like protease SBT5.6 [Pistacia vera]